MMMICPLPSGISNRWTCVRAEQFCATPSPPNTQSSCGSGILKMRGVSLRFSCVLPKGAFYAFPNTSGTGIPSRVLEDELLNEAGVACLAGTSFGDFGEGYMRFSYANSVANIREGLRRVREHLERRGS